MPTITRPHQVTSRTVEPGDILREGYGTPTITTREVATIERWYHNGYCNAAVTFTNGDTKTLWADTHVENRVYYMQRDGVAA